MALGKIKADTLEHSTAGSLDTSYVVNGSAKAWIHYVGNVATVTILDGINHASISDLGTGRYSVTFTSSFNNATYASNVTGSTTRAGNNDTDTHATGGITHEYFYASGTFADPKQGQSSIHGDLA